MATATTQKTCRLPRGELLTSSHAARVLGVTSRTLRRWAAAGRVPHWVLFRPRGHAHTFYRRSCLELWLQEGVPAHDGGPIL